MSNLNFEKSGGGRIESKIIFEGHDISIAQWEKRTPGKFKPEFVGEGIICLNSKCVSYLGVG